MKVIFGSKLCRACLRGSDDRIKFFENENSLNQFQYIFNQKVIYKKLFFHMPKTKLLKSI